MIEFFDSACEQLNEPAPRTYDVLPEGEHELEIIAASIGTVEWKTSTENPTGECLRLRLSAGDGTAFVFADLPRDRKYLFKALAASLGLKPGPDGKVSLGTPEALVGRRVRVAIGHYVTRAGETRANVKRWLPATAPASPAPVPAARPTIAEVIERKPATRRSHATKPATSFVATGDDDDIPF
jgi:hypothetical protein